MYSPLRFMVFVGLTSLAILGVMLVYSTADKLFPHLPVGLSRPLEVYLQLGLYGWALYIVRVRMLAHAICADFIYWRLESVQADMSYQQHESITEGGNND